MIMDNFFSGGFNRESVMFGQLVTALGVTVSPNAIDTAPGYRGSGAIPAAGGKEAPILYVHVLQTPTSAGAATICFEYIQADDAGLTQNVNVIATSPVFLASSLTAGSHTTVRLSNIHDKPVPRRYQGVRFVVGVAALTNSTGQFLVAQALDEQSTLGVTQYRTAWTIV